MDFIGRFLHTALLTVLFLAALLVLGYKAMLAIAVAVAVLMGYWNWSGRVIEKCGAGCWRCIACSMWPAWAVSGVLGVAFVAWVVW